MVRAPLGGYQMFHETIILSGEESAQMKTIALLIQKASDFRASIHVQCGDRRANAKSLLGLMSLGLATGDEVTIQAEGEDAEEAVKVLCEWMRNPVED